MATRRPRLGRLLAPAVTAALLGAVMLVVLASPALAGGSCHAAASDGSGATVVMRDLCFTPTVLRAEPGQKITFVNSDGIQHPVVGAGGRWGLPEATLAGSQGSISFDQPGLYPYYCHVHVGMIGVIVVGDSSKAGTATPVQVAAPLDAAAQAQATDQASAPAAAKASAPADPDRGRGLALALGLAVVLGAAGATGAGALLRRARR
jgi:plastocyanin